MFILGVLGGVVRDVGDLRFALTMLLLALPCHRVAGNPGHRSCRNGRWQVVASVCSGRGTWCYSLSVRS